MSVDMVGVHRHGIEVEFLDGIPEEVDAGTDLTLTLKVSSSFELDVTSTPFLIMAGDDVWLTGRLSDFTGADRQIVKIAVAAPDEIGEFAWHFVIPEHECEGTVCPKASLPFSFRTRPHVTSLAVWDYPSPVVVGAKFKLKVGAQCSAACASLSGKELEIRDENDSVVACVPLRGTPWPDTAALYWAEVDLPAPANVGLHSWTVRFSPAQLHPLHNGASCAFSFLADRPPEHKVSVQVVERETETPIDDAQVRCGAYRTSTDATGLAWFTVPGGRHELSIWKVGFEAPARIVEVKDDVKLRIEAKRLPTANPEMYWQG
jgi:hypothetical protein